MPTNDNYQRHEIYIDLATGQMRLRAPTGDAAYAAITALVDYPDGTVALPSIGFAKESSSGLYRIAAGILGTAILGVERLRLSATELLVSTGLRSTSTVQSGDGTSAAPGHSFGSETSLGLWRIGAASAGFAGSLALKGPGPWVDVKAYGAVGDGVTDDTTAIQAAITAAEALGAGATVFFPASASFYLTTVALVVTGANITFLGGGGRGTSGTASWIRCTAVVARVIDARSTGGFALRNIFVQATAAAFVGTLLDLSVNAANWMVEGCTFQSVNTGSSIDLSSGAIEGEIRGVLISGGSIGVNIGGTSSTTIRIIDANFNCTANYRAIVCTSSVELAGLTLLGITLEGSSLNMNQNLIDFSGATLIRGLDIAGLWSGDMGATSTGSVIHLGTCRGAMLHGNFIAGGGNAGAQIGITVGANSDGVAILGNDIFSLGTGISVGAGVTDFFQNANRLAAGTQVAGTWTLVLGSVLTVDPSGSITAAANINITAGGSLSVAANATVGPATGGKVIAAGTLTAGGLLGSAVQVATSGPLIYSGSGAPTISAAVKGSLYMRTDGTTTATRAYVATDTVGGWTAITTAT